MEEFRFTVSSAWQETYPDALVGLLMLGDVANLSSDSLEERTTELEQTLRSRFAGFTRPQLRALPRLQAYERYYRRFQKTYHVQLQMESIALKGKAIPRVGSLVEAMFLTELYNQLLTAGHDRATLDPPLRLDVAQGSEVYTLYNGQEQSLKPGDMFIADRQGILSSILYGPDQRTRISDNTRRVVYTAYGVTGIERAAMEQHLQDILANVRLASPSVRVEWQEICSGH